MACPTCEHTMHKVGVMDGPYTGVGLYWCPRCGTLKANVIIEEHNVPKLVDRCQDFECYMKCGTEDWRRWVSIGINEAIHLPKDRDHEQL